MTTIKNTATLLVTCPDQKGIVAAIANFLLQHDANILHADQHQDSENNLFTWSVGTTAYTCVNLKFNNGENDTIPDPFIGTASQV